MPTCSSPATLLDQDCGTGSDQAWTWQWWHRGQVLTSSCPHCHQTRAWHQGSPGWLVGTSHVVLCCLHLQIKIYGTFNYKKLCNFPQGGGSCQCTLSWEGLLALSEHFCPSWAINCGTYSLCFMFMLKCKWLNWEVNFSSIYDQNNDWLLQVQKLPILPLILMFSILQSNVDWPLISVMSHVLVWTNYKMPE